MMMRRTVYHKFKPIHIFISWKSIDVKFELEEREKVVDYIVGLDKQERDEFLAEIINQILKGTVKKR